MWVTSGMIDHRIQIASFRNQYTTLNISYYYEFRAETLSYLEPTQSIKEYRREAGQMALAGGDIQIACINTLTMLYNQFWLLDPLTQIKEAASIAEKVRKTTL